MPAVRAGAVKRDGDEPRLVEELARALAGAGRRDHPPVGRTGGSVQMALLELDLAGRLDRHAGGKVSLTA